LVAGGPRGSGWKRSVRPIRCRCTASRCRSPAPIRRMRRRWRRARGAGAAVRAGAGLGAPRLVAARPALPARPAPFPRSDEALLAPSAHVAQVQDALGRTIALENPSHYLAIEGMTGAKSTSSPRSRAAPAATCCSTSTTSRQRAQHRSLGRGLCRCIPGRSGGRDPPRGPSPRPGARRAPPHRFARRGGPRRSQGCSIASWSAPERGRP
jgi:hypothetical protein